MEITYGILTSAFLLFIAIIWSTDSFANQLMKTFVSLLFIWSLLDLASRAEYIDTYGKDKQEEKQQKAAK